MPFNYDSKFISNQNMILNTKDNSVFSNWRYSSRISGGKKRSKTRKYKRGKIGKGRRTRRLH